MMGIGKALPVRKMLFPPFVLVSMVLGVLFRFNVKSLVVGVSTFCIPLQCSIEQVYPK